MPEQFPIFKLAELQNKFQLACGRQRASRTAPRMEHRFGLAGLIPYTVAGATFLEAVGLTDDRQYLLVDLEHPGAIVVTGQPLVPLTHAFNAQESSLLKSIGRYGFDVCTFLNPNCIEHVLGVPPSERLGHAWLTADVENYARDHGTHIMLIDEELQEFHFIPGADDLHAEQFVKVITTSLCMTHAITLREIIPVVEAHSKYAGWSISSNRIALLGDNPDKKKKPRNPPDENRPNRAQRRSAAFMKTEPHEMRMNRGDVQAIVSELISSNRAAAEKDPSVAKRAAKLARDAVAIGRNVENRKFYANTFSAGTFTAENFKQVLLHHTGASEIDTNPQAAMQLVRDIIDGTAIHPKRYGPPGHSRVDQTISDTKLYLSDLTPGNDVIIICVLNRADLGGLVFQRSQEDFAPALLGVLTPNKDLQDIGDTSATLFTKLSCSAPQVVGGTTTNIASISAEAGVTCVNPLQLIAGKCSMVSFGNKCANAILSSTTPIEVACFSDGVMETANLVSNRAAAQNNALVLLTPSSADTSTTDRCITGRTPLSLDMSLLNTLTTTATPSCEGLFSFSDGAQTNFAIFKLSEATDYVRKLWFGDFRLQATAMLPASTITSGGYYDWQFKVEFHGSTPDYTFGNRQSLPTLSGVSNWNQNQNFFINTLGDKNFPRDAIIKDIRLLISTPSTGFSMIPRTVDLTWYNISSDTQYQYVVLSGANPQALLNVKLETHTEVFVDPSAIAAKYTPPTMDPAYMPEGCFGHLVRCLGKQSHDPSLYTASGFSKFMGKVGRSLGREAKHIGREVVHDGIRAGEHMLFAKGFRPGVHSAKKSSNFAFPAISRERDIGELVPVIPGRGCPNRDIVDTFGDIVKPFKNNTVGSSSGLAYLLAALDQSGVVVPPGNYSGEIADLVYVPGKVLDFTLLPVDLRTEKCEVSAITGLFADGWYVRGKPSTFGPRRMFPVCRSADADVVTLADPYPDGSYGIHVHVLF